MTSIPPAGEMEAECLRNEGSKYYMNGEYTKAIEKYECSASKYKAISLKDWEAKTLCNISLCYLKLNNPERALEVAGKCVQLDSSNAEAYYRRAQALEMLKCFEDCINSFTTSFELRLLRKTIYMAVTTAITHGLRIRGIPVDTIHKKYLKESDATYSKTDISNLHDQCVEEKAFRVIPLLAFILKAEMNYHRLVEGIDWPENEDEVHKMVSSIESHVKFLELQPECEAKLKAAKIMGTRLLQEAIVQHRPPIVEIFLKHFEIEGDVIDISELLKSGKSSLCYEPKWLTQMFRKGAHLLNCVFNAIEEVLKVQYTQVAIQLNMIEILLQNGGKVHFERPHTTIIHEVLNITLKCEGNMDALRAVCDQFDFESKEVCNEDGETPWHLALRAKRNKTSIEVCKVLRDYCINPGQKDKQGRRPDYKKSENDRRVILLREKETDMKKEEGSPLTKQKEKQKKKRKKKANESLQKDKLPDNHFQAEKRATADTSTIVDRPVEDPSVSDDEEMNILTLDEIKDDLKQHVKRLNECDDDYFHYTPVQEHKRETPFTSTTIVVKPTDSSDHPHPKRRVYGEGDVKKFLSGHSEVKHDFDNQTWEIECSEKVMKILSGRKHGHIKPLFLEKMMMIAQGEFLENQRHSKSVTRKKGLELYETRLNDKTRIIWQIAIQFSKGVFTEVIRVWDVVLDHDKIHHCVNNIERNAHDRGHEASHLVQCSLRCVETGSSVKGNKRSPKTFVQIKEPTDKEEDQMFIPPIHPEKSMYTIASMYSLTTHVVKCMLEDGNVEKAFPYQEWPREHDIINMGNKEAILLLGRSGTGKTTCCLYRLWNEFKCFWSTTFDRADPDIEVCESACLPISLVPDTHTVTKECDSMEEEYKREDSTKIQEVTINEEKHSYLRQVFVTKNYVLCSRLRKQFFAFAATEPCAKVHMQSKDEMIPQNLMDVANESYPLFLTARQFYVLLDYSLQDNNYFFKRDEEGNMMEKILCSDYDHEDTDTLYDLADSEDEEALFQQLYPISQKQQKSRREVTASYFDEKIWPKIQTKTGNMSSLMVWMEIKSFIKGSQEAMESQEGFLSRQKYIDVGKKAAPNFAGNRDIVYNVFKEYRLYVQNHPLQNLFDECDLVYHVFGRLPKQRERLQWVLHTVYIDEVQDFTQGELWLILHNCQDPNGFFLAGDTAQSIMSGISFRFEDVKTLFHHLQEKEKTNVQIVVPTVKHLNINFRSHSGILNLAASVTDVLKEYFPHSFDHKNLPPEQGLVTGPKPVFFNSCSASDLAMVIAGNKRTFSSIDFGAHQVILVRNQEAKKGLPRALSSAIVLTIFESKGLEFDDVLLYNFFKDSNLSEEWRTLVSYCDKHLKEPREADDIVSCKKPHPLDFMEDKHKQFCSELKHLYTAITRTRTKLWLYDECDEKHQPALYYWQRCGSLVTVVNVEEMSEKSEEIFVSSSTSEDWKARGEEFMQHKLWSVARKCFQRAECCGNVQECDALLLIEKARKLPRAERQSTYLTAAIAFLKCDNFEHRPKVLVQAAKCLYNGKFYDNAAWLYTRLRRFDEAFKGYSMSKNFEQCVEVMEKQQKHKEALLFLFHKCNPNKAVEHASRYVSTKCIGVKEIAPSIVKYGKQLIREFSKSGEKMKLLALIEIIPPKLQVPYLTKVGAYDRAATVLLALEKYEDAYTLMLKQAMYNEAFNLAKQLSDLNKIHQTLLCAAKSKLSHHSAIKTCHTEVPNLHAELTQMCKSKNVTSFVKAMAYLLYSKLTNDENTCHEALKLFCQDSNTLGQSEAFVVLAGLPAVKKNIMYVEQMVEVCVETKKICSALESGCHEYRHTANFTNIVHKVEDFYGFTKEKNEYSFPHHQDAWNLHLNLDSHELQAPTLKPNAVYRVVCCHLESNIRVLVDNEETQKVVKHSLEAFTFHHKQIERPFNYSHGKLYEYLKSYCLHLQIMQLVPPSNSADLNTWKKYFLDLFTVRGLLFLNLDDKHFEVIRSFPGAEKILKEEISSVLIMPTHSVRLDEWIKVWLLSHVLKTEDEELKQRIRPIASGVISYADRHFFVRERNGELPHFHYWVTACSLFREGTRALVAIKILTKYIETIARRRSLHEGISVSNTVFMIGISTMVWYAFLAFQPQITIVVPQIVVDMMECFNRINCQKHGDKTIFQICMDTLKCINPQQAILYAINGIVHIFEVIVGAYREQFNILKCETTNTQFSVPCIALGLTLLGNMSLSGKYIPSALLDYQRHVLYALQPILQQTNESELKQICGKFPCCTSSREVFTLVQKLNQLHHRVHSGSISDLFLIQVIGGRLRLSPTYPRKVPENSIIPLDLKCTTSVANQTEPTSSVNQSSQQTEPSSSVNQSSQQTGPSSSVNQSSQQTGPSSSVNQSSQQNEPSSSVNQSSQQNEPSSSVSQSCQQTEPSSSVNQSSQQTEPSSSVNQSSQQSEPSSSVNQSCYQTEPSSSVNQSSQRTEPSSSVNQSSQQTEPSSSVNQSSQQTEPSSSINQSSQQTEPSSSVNQSSQQDPRQQSQGIVDSFQQWDSANDLDFNRLESHSSNEDSSDEEVKEALEIQINVAETVQKQISVDTTIADEEFCQACGLTLQRKGNSETLREHIGTEDHKRKEMEFKRFLQAAESFEKQIGVWEDEVNKWEDGDKTNDLESIISDVKYKTKSFGGIKDVIKKHGEWMDGELEIQRANDQIKDIIEKGRQELERMSTVHDTKPDQYEPPVQTQSDEEELSDFECDDVTPRQARINRRKGKHVQK